MKEDAITLATQWGQKIQEALMAYGPKAGELALALGRIEAFKILLHGFAYAAVGVALIFAAEKARAACAGYVPRREYDDGHLGYGIVASVLYAIAVPTLISSCINLLNPYAWVGLSQPEVVIAARALGLL